MAIKKDSTRQVIVVDPAVNAALEGNAQSDVYQRIERARKMTPSQKKKMARDAARSKATYDLPASLIERVEVLARDVYGVPASHLAGLLMLAGLQAVAESKLNVYDYRVPAKALRFDYALDLQKHKLMP